MKYLKLYESIENIHEVCKEYNIKNYTINSDGSIDVDGNVNLQCKYLTKLPLKFRNVNGDFVCSRNYLTSLEGSPTHVGGNFYCGGNKLTILEYSPYHVSHNFYCTHNNITSLEGFPSHIGGNFYCKSNPVYQVWELFEDESKIELFNDYDIIRGTDIVLDRLNDFLTTIGKDPVESVKGYNNI